MSENGISNWLGDFFNGFMEPMRLFLKWCNWMGVVLFSFFYTLVKVVMYSCRVIFDHITATQSLYASAGSAISGNTATSAFSDWFVAINTFIPLDLILVYVSIIFQLWLFWNTYRLAKSWIPTLA